jgi:hypothetical protein
MANLYLRNSLSRRTLLRGTGAVLALPWLDAMGNQSLAETASESASPKRFAALWMPNGVRANTWTPHNEGTGYDLSPTLEPLSNCRDDVSVYTNLWHQNTDSGDGHYVKCSGFLTGMTIHKTVGIDLNSNGVSLDQLIAQQIGNQTPLPSMELGTEPVRTGVDKAVGYTRVYGAHVAWKSPTMPLAKEIDPRLAFERLFNAGKQTASSKVRDRSLLDAVLADAQQLQHNLGATDRRKVDEYLESVRAVEVQLNQLDAVQGQPWSPRVAIDQTQAPAVPETHAMRVKLMLDVIALAFQSDTTRVTTFMFGNSVSDIDFSFVDSVKGTHHGLSHHENDEEKMRQYQLINRWHVEQFAYLVEKLRGMSEGDSNVLHNSVLLFGAGLRDGNSHNPHNLPILVAGRAGGRLISGQHRKYAEDTPLSNLYMSMLNALDVKVDKFADSTELLPNVLA